MRYEFTCFETDIHGEENGNKISTSFHADSLQTMLERFEQFLRGSGFYFSGVVDIVPEEGSEDDVKINLDNDSDTIFGGGGPNPEHSPFYYDFDRNRPYSEDLGAAQSTLRVDLPEQYNFNIDGNVFGSDYDIIIGEPNER